MTTALSFDAALKQLFPPLLRGEKVRLIAEETVTQPDRLAAALGVDGEATSIVCRHCGKCSLKLRAPDV